jgi:protein gp37
MPSKIEWCDETLNPLGWGCYGPGGTPEDPQPCSYCYARRMAIGHPFRDCDLCKQFIPHWHPEQLEKPMRWKKPKKIFWQSMGDLFHPWTPWEQIHEVRKVVNFTPQHTHIFLTKNSKRLRDFNPWPKNCWVGTTVTNQADADERLPWLLQVEAPVRFVSHEPLLGAIRMLYRWLSDPRPHCKSLELGSPKTTLTGGVDWAIIGAMTGPGAVKVDACMVAALVNQYHDAGVPVFMKNNLKPPMGRLIQEWPA